jgi:predicted metal-dependent HD superfamily phosphohydrolase
MSDSYIHRHHENAWKEISSGLNLTKMLSAAWLIKIQYAYKTFGRLYHNMNHIEEGWMFMKTEGRSRFDLDAKIAWFFHDYVCVPGNTDNEEESASWAEYFIKNTDSEKLVNIDNIKYLILHTKHNEQSRIEASKNADLAFFLDVDLIILGAPRRFYEKYMDGVRDEYLANHIDPMDYNKGRYNFLDNLLKLDNIFHTQEVRESYWARNAVENVKYEMNLIERVLNDYPHV